MTRQILIPAKVVSRVSMAAVFLLFAAESAHGMRKHFGRAADPRSGAALPGASVWILLPGTATPATVFADAKGAVVLKNPIHADAGGRFSFYVGNGKYRLRIASAAGIVASDVDDIRIFDPREPQTILATEQQPALSLHTLPQLADVNLPLVMERRDQNDALVGARWRILSQFTEKGWVLPYNYRRRGGAALPSLKRDALAYKDIPYVDTPNEPSIEAIGTNDADDGYMGWPGFRIFGGGEWMGGAHLVEMNVQLTTPEGKNPIGIAIRMEAPKQLAVGDLVVLDTHRPSAVMLTNARGARFPFVISKVDDSGVGVLVRGLAWVKVEGVVEAGDILGSSSKPGSAIACNAISDPSRSLGVAVTKGEQGWALARIQRITLKR